MDIHKNARLTVHGRERIVRQEILSANGVDYAGSLAADIQFLQVFSAAIVAGSGEVDNAKRLIAFFTSLRAAEAIKKSGMEPVAIAR
jgi:molybdate transport system substrate-binding protein